jgi:hypothetical protein
MAVRKTGEVDRRHQQPPAPGRPQAVAAAGAALLSDGDLAELGASASRSGRGSRVKRHATRTQSPDHSRSAGDRRRCASRAPMVRRRRGHQRSPPRGPSAPAWAQSRSRSPSVSVQATASAQSARYSGLRSISHSSWFVSSIMCSGMCGPPLQPSSGLGAVIVAAEQVLPLLAGGFQRGELPERQVQQVDGGRARQGLGHAQVSEPLPRLRQLRLFVAVDPGSLAGQRLGPGRRAAPAATSSQGGLGAAGVAAQHPWSPAPPPCRSSPLRKQGCGLV